MLVAIAPRSLIEGIANWALIVVGAAIGSVVGVVGARNGEDDRDAADGGAVQRRRRRRGGAHRARGVPRARRRAGAGTRALSIALSALIGSISFSGSLVAFAKLQELISGRPIIFPGQKVVNVARPRRRGRARRRDRRGPRGAVGDRRAHRARARLRRPVRAPDRRRGHAGRDLAAERLHRPRRGRDRLRARHDVLIVAGMLVGASGTLLTLLMAKAMNRSVANVLFGAFGAGAGRASAQRARGRRAHGPRDDAPTTSRCSSRSRAR